MPSHRPSAHPPMAMVLLGPTGSGKTPLGELLDERGWKGRRCRHFDFGARLRMVTDPTSGCSAGLTPDELSVVRSCLKRGALLENETFGIAAKILDSFVGEALPGQDELLILNGLPRHVGQAEMLADQVDVVTVLALDCDACTVHERIRLDTGGDRARRSDDEVEAVRKRLEIYHQRTTPLMEHYREKGAEVIHLSVTVHSSAEQLLVGL